MQNHPRLHSQGGPATPCSKVPTEGGAVGLDPKSPALFAPLWKEHGKWVRTGLEKGEKPPLSAQGLGISGKLKPESSLPGRGRHSPAACSSAVVLAWGFPLISPPPNLQPPATEDPLQNPAAAAGCEGIRCEIPRDSPMGRQARFSSAACHCQVIDKAIN